MLACQRAACIALQQAFIIHLYPPDSRVLKLPNGISTGNMVILPQKITPPRVIFAIGHIPVCEP